MKDKIAITISIVALLLGVVSLWENVWNVHHQQELDAYFTLKTAVSVFTALTVESAHARLDRRFAKPGAERDSLDAKLDKLRDRLFDNTKDLAGALAKAAVTFRFNPKILGLVQVASSNVVMSGSVAAVDEISFDYRFTPNRLNDFLYQLSSVLTELEKQLEIPVAHVNMTDAFPSIAKMQKETKESNERCRKAGVKPGQSCMEYPDGRIEAVGPDGGVITRWSPDAGSPVAPR